MLVEVGHFKSKSIFSLRFSNTLGTYLLQMILSYHLLPAVGRTIYECRATLPDHSAGMNGIGCTHQSTHFPCTIM